MSPECLSRDAINDKSFFVTFFMCKVSKSYSNPISDTVNPPYETLTYVDLTSWRHKMNLKNLSVPRRYRVVRPVTKWFDDLNLDPNFSRLACRGLKLSRDHPYILLFKLREDFLDKLLSFRNMNFVMLLLAPKNSDFWLRETQNNSFLKNWTIYAKNLLRFWRVLCRDDIY